MIFLTGDIHHMSMKTRDQALLDNRTEVDCCVPYLKIANFYGIKPTLFFTGKAVKEEGTKIKRLYSDYSLEIGGHTYRAFRFRHFRKTSSYFYGACSRLLGLRNGPRILQKRDIELTIKTIQNMLGVHISAWRNHGYRRDKNSYKLLSTFGIKIVSDDVDCNKHFPEKVEENLYSFPINVLPDHEYLRHSIEHQTSYEISQWRGIVERQIVEIEDEYRGIAILLVHPACMFIEDKFQHFTKLCKFISQYDTCSLIEASCEYWS